MRYLVDTDWAIDYMHGVSPLVSRLNRLLPDGVGLSVISLAELYDGVLGSRNPQSDEQALRRFLASVEALPLDESTCRVFAEERRRLRAAGALISDLDLLIGSTAIRHNLTLLTNNRRHFGLMANLSLVPV